MLEERKSGLAKNKVAHIVSTTTPEHWHEDTELFKVVTVSIEGVVMEFSSVYNRTLWLNETMVFGVKGGETQWDGENIGAADINVEQWLTEKGYTIVRDDLTALEG